MALMTKEEAERLAREWFNLWREWFNLWTQASPDEEESSLAALLLRVAGETTEPTVTHPSPRVPGTFRNADGTCCLCRDRGGGSACEICEICGKVEARSASSGEKGDAK
jgi:hypothetical protein